MTAPIPYHPDLETIDPSERDVIAEMNETFDTILERVAEDEDHAHRGVHAKSHGLIAARVAIHDNLPPELAQGVFATPGTHDAVLRLSTNPGDILDDAISVPRGLALKIVDVPGARLSSAYASTSQDWVLINGPAFSATTAGAFGKTLKLLARTTDRAEWGKKILSKALRGVEKALESTVGGSATIQTLGGAPNVHPLGETYYSQTPFRYGDYVAKLQVRPVSDSLTRLTGEIVDTRNDPDALRGAIDTALRHASARWEIRVQLLRDIDAQPIEDATVVWDEDRFPFETVATITAEQQPAWTDARAAQVDDGMRFSPWNGIEAHQPLGSINRARKATYDHSAQVRERINGCPIHDPKVVALDN